MCAIHVMNKVFKRGSKSGAQMESLVRGIGPKVFASVVS
jgi:hypothetical protein